jgi:hypothetical protein
MKRDHASVDPSIASANHRASSSSDPVPVHPDKPAAPPVTTRDLLLALDRLTPETIPSWGKLSATGMVRHINQTIDLHLGRIQAPLHLRLLGRIMAGPFVRMVLSKPYNRPMRNSRSLPQLMPPASGIDFNIERERLRRQLEEIDAMRGTYANPVLGRMEASTLREMTHHHLRYHLFQFGVID